MILLAAFTSLRWAELAALTLADIDLEARTVRVTRQLYYHEAGYSFRPPKSRAGVRVVSFPELIVPDVRKHLEWLPSSADRQRTLADAVGKAASAELAKSKPRKAAKPSGHAEGTRPPSGC